jgi:F-type H+-transporting ATPase subunit gamma
MRRSRPYGDKVRNIAAHLAHANPEYRHPFLVRRDTVKAAGLVLVTTDKGLCGGLNTNILRMTVQRLRELEKSGAKVQVTAIGNKGLGFMQRIGAKVVSQAVHLGDAPQHDKLIGPIKLQLDAYAAGVPELAWIVEDRVLQAALWRALEAQDGLEIIAPARCAALALGEEARVTLEDAGCVHIGERQRRAFGFPRGTNRAQQVGCHGCLR